MYLVAMGVSTLSIKYLLCTNKLSLYPQVDVLHVDYVSHRTNCAIVRVRVRSGGLVCTFKQGRDDFVSFSCLSPEYGLKGG